MPLHEILFVSHRSPEFDLRELGNRVERARADLAAAGVSGVLMFDGQRLAGLLEGPRLPVERTAARIATDSWHVDYRVLHAGNRRGLRRCKGWRLVWLVADGTIDRALPHLATLRGHAAVDALLAGLADLPPHPAAG